jgi:hypothetical protein
MLMRVIHAKVERSPNHGKELNDEQEYHQDGTADLQQQGSTRNIASVTGVQNKSRC